MTVGSDHLSLLVHVFLHLCILVAVKIYSHLPQAGVSTPRQDLRSGSPIEVHVAFHNSLPATAQHAVTGQRSAPMMQQETILCVNTRMCDTRPITMEHSQRAPFVQRQRGGRDATGAARHRGSAAAQSMAPLKDIHSSHVKTQGECSKPPEVDVLRSGPHGD